MRFWLSYLMCFFIISLSGCQLFKPPAIEQIPEFKGGTPLSLKKTKSLLFSLKKKYESFNTLSSLIKISFQIDGSSKTIKQVFIFEKNSFLRVEVLSIFGQPILYFLSDSKIINIYNPGENTFFYGKATAENIHKLMGIGFKPYEIAKLLPAIIKISENNKSYAATEKDANIILEISDETETILIIMDKKDLKFSHMIKYDNKGTKILEVTYSDYKKIDGFIFPFIVKVDMPHKKKTIKVRSKEVSINKELSPEMKTLKLPAPDKVRMINIDKS